MKRFLILQLRPEDETSDNEYEAILEFGGLSPEETDRRRIEETGIPELDLHQYAGIIVGGSPFDLTIDEERKSPTQKQLELDFGRLFNEVIMHDIPFLGACSGNGLLGRYCGTNISKHYGEPVGGVDIHVTEAGQQDPLLAGLPSPFRALVGHKEACDETPPGAVLLASSDTCPVQMFRVGENVYATQFHPEGDPNGFRLRILIYKNHGYFPPETAEELISAIEQEETPHSQEILRRFVERYRG